MVLDKDLQKLIQLPHIPDTQRKELITNAVQSSTQENGYNEAGVIYSMCLKHIQEGSAETANIPLYIISVYGNKYPESLRQFVTSAEINQVLNEEDPDKLAIILVGLKDILEILHADIDYMSSIYSISITLEDKLSKNGRNAKILSLISDLYTLCPILLPQSSKRLDFTISILNHVASFPIPTKPETVKYMDSIGTLLTNLWEPMQMSDLLFSLYSMYSLLSSKEITKVCPAMAHILSLVHPQIVVNLGPRLVQTSTNRAFTATLNRLASWLVTWPIAYKTLVHWIRTLVRLLYETGRQIVPAKMTVDYMPQLLDAMYIPLCRRGVVSVVTILLMSFQWSPIVFHKVIPKLIALLQCISKENAVISTESVTKLVLLCHCLMTMFPGYPETYHQLMEVLTEFPQPSLDEIDNQIKEYDWTSTVKNTFVMAGKGIGKYIGQGSAEQVSSQRRALGQKSGLSNLGNTCYMNSVIQALFMTDDFRHCVFESESDYNRSVLPILQKLFAQLSFSDRTYAAPRVFHDESRPSWFSAGTQQDCSEYCRHLLVTLHEEEKAGQHLPDYQERMVVESETVSVASDLQVLSEDLYQEPTPESLTEKVEEMLVDKQSDSDDVTCHEMDCIEDELIEQTFISEKSDSSDSSSSSKRKHSPEVAAFLPMGKASRGDSSPSSSKEVDSSSDSGISGDLAEDQECPLTATYSQQTFLPELITPSECKSYFESGVQKVFGGKISTCTKCLNCKTESIHKDTFTDINLAFEDADHCNAAATKDTCRSQLTIDDMINNYLKPETLSGENQYECDRCARKQDAVRSIRILQAPSHLILTQLRFYYDKTKGQRQKVFTNVDFDEHVYLPVHCPTLTRSNSHDDVSSESGSVHDQPDVKHEKYALYGVVVHSGFSSEGGHYYCYARNSSVAALNPDLQQSYGTAGGWHNFNDENVSEATFDSISRLTKTFTRDTPYILFYKKVNQLDERILVDDLDRLPPHLRNYVEAQNLGGQSASYLQPNLSSPSKDSDSGDQPPPSGGCGGGGGNNITSREIF